MGAPCRQGLRRADPPVGSRTKASLFCMAVVTTTSWSGRNCACPKTSRAPSAAISARLRGTIEREVPALAGAPRPK